jgi:hypothetical protein
MLVMAIAKASYRAFSALLLIESTTRFRSFVDSLCDDSDIEPPH